MSRESELAEALEALERIKWDGSRGFPASARDVTTIRRALSAPETAPMLVPERCDYGSCGRLQPCPIHGDLLSPDSKGKPWLMGNSDRLERLPHKAPEVAEGEVEGNET